MADKYGDTPAGLVSVETDSVLADPLKMDTAQGDYDRLSVDASKRVPTYYKEYGLSLLPEDFARVEATQKAYKANDKSASSALQKYRQGFFSSLAEADARSAQALASIKPGKVSAPGMQMTTVRVTSGNNVEASYNVPQSVADALAKEKGIYTAQTPEGFNVDVRAKGGAIVGQELHDALRDAQAQGQAIAASRDRSISQARAAAARVAEIQRKTLAAEIANQRNIALKGFANEFMQGLQRYYQLGRDWANELTSVRNAQRAGAESNASGIREVIKSGVLQAQAGNGQSALTTKTPGIINKLKV